MSTQVKIEKMLQKTAVVLAAGGEKRIAKQYAAGKMTAWERIASLLDENSFVELDRFVKHRCTDFGQSQKALPGEGVTTGYGTVSGRLVYVFAQDFTVEGGSLGEMHAAKIVKVQRLALKWVRRLSDLTIPAEHVFRKLSMPCPAMARFFSIILWPRE